MTKKEIQKALNNLPEPEYLYNRYDGEIRKYEVQDNILINVKNINDIVDTDKHLLLGKLSKNKLNLLEVGDLIIYKFFTDNLNLKIIEHESDLQNYKNYFKEGLWEFNGFVTKEKLNIVINNMKD